ncbi:alpha-2-macroglobulin [Moorena sp. SIO1F2]|uniref:alpha-2-macroglobulin family protein n=1 Tax=Moorena sp. SIO1F2 TaxID=2607819 RepID=UPI00345BB085
MEAPKGKSRHAMGRVIKTAIGLLLGLSLILGIISCDSAKLTSGFQPLPAVAPLPMPQIPEWIEQISPIGMAEPLSQIRIRFKDPLIPVERLGSPNQREILQKFEIIPPIPGKFRFLTPRMVGFQADQALPLAARVQVTIKAGLADLNNHSLEQDLAWTFNTAPIQLTNLPATQRNPEAEPEPIALEPKLQFTSNTQLDLASVKQHLTMTPKGQTQSVKLDVALKEQADVSNEYRQPAQEFNPSLRQWIYTITPKQPLTKATDYKLAFAPGVGPARGNIPTETAFVSQVKTFDPLTYKKITFYGQPEAGGAYGRFVKGAAQLEFNNPLLASSAMEHITVEPAPKEAPKLVQAYDGNRFVNLNPWALEPETTYTVTLGANLTDQFGQTLGEPVTFKYETGDLAGDIWAPSDLHIFPSTLKRNSESLQLNISTVNLPQPEYKAAYRIVQPTDLVYKDSAYPSGKSNDLLPNPSQWERFRVAGKKNKTTNIAVSLRKRLGGSTGMLAYGVQAKTYRYQDGNGNEKWWEPKYYGMVQLTNLGVFAQWFPDSGLVQVNHLSNGSPAAATVEIYKSELNASYRGTPKPCAIAKTDRTGTIALNSQALRQCMNGATRFTKGPQLLVIAKEGKDWAFTRTNEYSGYYGYGIYSDWDNGKPKSRGTIFSDRQLYQPGEKAWFTAAAYYLEKDKLTQDKNASYQVTLVEPNGKKTDLGTKKTNEFGTFSLELPLKENQPLGFYTVEATGSNGKKISGGFRVAEFNPPNFKVDLTLAQKFANMGEKVDANVQGNYWFGSNVDGGKVAYYVTRTPVYFTPAGWEEFSFGQQWFWPQERPQVTSDVLQTNQTLSESGESSLTIPVTKDLPYPMTYRVDSQVTDVSNLSVSDSKTFTALPSDKLIGLKGDWVADAGKPFSVDVIVTDPTGKVIKGQSVRLELQEMKYSSVTQVLAGSQREKNQVEYKTVKEVTVRSGSSPKSIKLTPPSSGSYRIRANFAKAKNDLAATDLQIWATGGNAVYWGSRYDNSRLDIKLDKDSYKPGETATALIQSPYAEGELYFSVVRNNTLYRKVVKVKGGAPEIKFKVTPEMVPNAAVEAVVVRQGKPLSQVEPGSVENLVRIGFAPFNTSLDDNYLKVTETLQSKSIEPGAKQTVELALQDSKGKPVKGQFTVMVVNEAILQLSGYQVPDLVETVYAQQDISTRFSDNRPKVVLENLAAQMTRKGWGYGGGKSSGAASTRIRTEFKPLAYYNGSLVTDANGKARVTFKLPDNLTTWRVMAVATDGNLHFGNGQATFITTKRLMANPVLPQFARPGDRFKAGIALINNTGQTGDLQINGQLTGAVQFDGGKGPTLNQKTSAKNGTSGYRFPMVANNLDKAKVKFTTKLNGNQDGFEVPLAVKPVDITEQVVESGVTRNQVKIPVNIASNVVPDAGGLEISLASTLIPEITAPAKQVLDNEDLPFLEPVASKLAIASNLEILGKQYGQTFAEFNPSQQSTEAIKQLQKLQRPDGGFARWPGQKSSDPFVSPYAATALARAKAAGLSVDAGMVSRLQNYLQKILANPGQYDYCKSVVCKSKVRLEALMGLAELGQTRSDFLGYLYEQSSNFDRVTQIKLARYLFQFPQWRSQAQTLVNQFQESIYQTGRSARINLPQSWRWLDSSTTAQAQALRLYIAQNSSAEVRSKLLQGLLELRRDGTWQTSYDNAQALSALVDYSRLQPTPPSFAATVELAGKKLGSAQFQGYQKPSQSIQVTMDKLPRGRHDLIVKKSGSGTLHYLTSYRYRLQGNQPGRFNGLRVNKTIRPANQEKVLRKIGLYALKDPLTVPAGQVFDIGVEVITDHPVDHVVIEDPLPAGLEAVDTSFQTATPYFQAQQDSWQIDYQKIHRDRIVAYADRLEAGVYNLHYLVRSVTPGTYLWPPAQAHLNYAPEEFGRSASSTLVISD